jgi:microcin C transport system permease protein
MVRYVARRLLLIMPTLLGIMAVNFAIVQVAPGGPIEQIIAELSGEAVSATAALTGSAGGDMGAQASMGGLDPGADTGYRGSRGLDEAMIRDLERQFGFDRPAHERFAKMLWSYARLDFGTSFYQDKTVVAIVASKLPVSITLGSWTLLIIYLVSIPLGIRKAVHDGTRFDLWTSVAIFVGYAVPGFLFAILLIVLFAGGSYWEIFPLRGLASEGAANMSLVGRILDHLWHIAMPVGSLVLGGFATLTMLTKNSFIEELGKHFVLTARSKGMSEQRVLYAHVFRNAMLLVISGFPQAFIGIFFTGSLLIEVIFSLDGIGRLGYEAVMRRDYPIVFGTVFCFSLVGLVMNLVSDVIYTVVDPRIDFASSEV